MAGITRWYPLGLKKVLDEGADNLTFHLMICENTFTYSAADQFVTASGAGGDEISVTGYTPGWGSASRKVTPGDFTFTFSADTSVPRVEAINTDVSWTLGAGATIGSVLLIVEGGASDATSDLIAYYAVNDRPTNGSQFTADFDADGNLRMVV